MTITSVATINTMVKARFDAADIAHITGSPEYDAIDKLVKAITQIATTFKTKWYGGKCGAPPSLSAKTRRSPSQKIMTWIAAALSNQISSTPGSPYPLSP